MDRILGVILAGGNSRRFGTDKAFAVLSGAPLIARAIARARPQVEHVALTVGRDPEPYAGFDLDLIVDATAEAQQGPLAGILASLALAEQNDFAYVASFACDTPFFPLNLVATLKAADADGVADCIVAARAGVQHRIFCLWRTTCRARLQAAFTGGMRKMEHVARALAVTVADFPADGDGPDGDPFFNINTAEDLAAAERYLNKASALFNV